MVNCPDESKTYWRLTFKDFVKIIESLNDFQYVNIWYNDPDILDTGEVLSVKAVKESLAKFGLEKNKQIRRIDFAISEYVEVNVEVLTEKRMAEIICLFVNMKEASELKATNIDLPDNYAPDDIIELAEKIKAFRAKKQQTQG